MQTPRIPVWSYLLAIVLVVVVGAVGLRKWRSAFPLASKTGAAVSRVARPDADGSADRSDPCETSLSPTPGDFDGMAVGPLVAKVAPRVEDLFEEDAAIADAGPSAAVTQPSDQAIDQNPLATDPSSDGLPVADEPATVSQWPNCPVLSERLKVLAEHELSASWACEVLDALDRLVETETLTSPGAPIVLATLTRLTEEGEELARSLQPGQLHSQILEAGYGLARRAAVWKQVRVAVLHAEPDDPTAPLDPSRIHISLDAIDRLLGTDPRRSQWVDYLQLDELRAAADPQTDDESRRVLARKVLSRVSSPRLSEMQREFIESGPIGALCKELRRWAAEPVDYPALVTQLEEYEQTHSLLDGQNVVRHWDLVRFSDDDALRGLSECIDRYYRNANVRLAVSDSLINRLAPQIDEIDDEIDDEMLGARIMGRNRIKTRLMVRMVPDPHRLRMRVEAHGEVDSETTASRGPVTLYNEGRSTFLARKLLLIDLKGLRTARAEADARTAAQVTGIASNYDGWPLIDALVRGAAQQQYESQQYEAEMEVERRIARLARRQMDEQMQERLDSAGKEFHKNIIAPLERLQLAPQARDMKTTKNRLIVRYRLAGDHQLAADSPRPCAPGDSHLSLQVHESALNNVVEQLNFDGKRTRLDELYRELGDVWGRKVEIPEDLPQNVTVQFADQEAVRVCLADGCATITLRFARLEAGRRRWKNFAVRAHYRREPSNTTAELARDGTIELTGQRLNFRDQIALRGIFSRVLSRNQRIRVIHKRVADDPRLKHLNVTQFVIRDGWIGVALGPERKSSERVAAEIFFDNR